MMLNLLRRIGYEIMGCYYGECAMCKKMITNDDDWFGFRSEKTTITCEKCTRLLNHLTERSGSQ